MKKELEIVTTLNCDDGSVYRITRKGSYTRAELIKSNNQEEMDIRQTILGKQKKEQSNLLKGFTGVDLEKAKAHPPGTINKYGEMKMGDGTWKYVGKQGHSHPAAVEARKQGHYQHLEEKTETKEDRAANEFKKLLGKEDAKVTVEKNSSGDYIVKVNGSSAFNLSDKEYNYKEKLESAYARSKNTHKLAESDDNSTSKGLSIINKKLNSNFSTNKPVELKSDVNLISLSNLKGKKLDIVGVKSTGLISQPLFLQVKDDKGQIHELNPDYLQNQDSTTPKKPTSDEVTQAIRRAGKALAEKRDPDAISTLRDEAKKLGMAYGMDVKKIDEAISTSRQGHESSMKKTRDDYGSFVSTGDKVRIARNLTSDPKNKQGEVGTIVQVGDEDTTDVIKVRFSDGVEGWYQSETFRKQ